MNNSFKFRLRFFALMAIFLVSVSSAFAELKTIAIINAGSSASRLYVYKVDTETLTITCLHPEEGSKEPSGEALSAIPNNEESVKVFLDTMTSKYSKKDASQIDLYVLATAGMRKIEKEKATDIYKHIKKYENKDYKVKEAMTISGRYEGLYAWIAAGCETGSLGPGISAPEKILTYSKPPYGIIEIGGASMQITFPANKSEDISRKGFANIYSESYINGGVNAMKGKTIYTYGEYVENLPYIRNQIPEGMSFYGLGGTINGINDNDKDKNKTFIDKIKNAKETGTYAPNAKYLGWVLAELDLSNRITPKKAEWTKGAACDIIINNQRPENFNYPPGDPN